MTEIHQIEEKITRLEKSISDNPLLNRPINRDLDITICNEKSLSLLWHEFEINVGRFLLSMWRDTCSRLPHNPVRFGERELVRIPPYGVTMQEASDALCKMATAMPCMRDYLPEQCSFTQYNDAGFAFTSADGRR